MAYSIVEDYTMSFLVPCGLLTSSAQNCLTPCSALVYAERKGLTIVEEYRDEGVSAKSLKGRPAE
jgi:hypothetical protein